MGLERVSGGKWGHLDAFIADFFHGFFPLFCEAEADRFHPLRGLRVGEGCVGEGSVQGERCVWVRSAINYGLKRLLEVVYQQQVTL